MSEWANVPLSDLTETPATYGVVQPGQNLPTGLPMLRVNNFRGHSLDLSDVMQIAPEIEAKYERTRIKAGDVLVTIVGSVGQVAIVSNDLSGWNIARAIAMIRPKEPELSRWIALVLRSPFAQYQLGVAANTTVQTTINLKDLRELRIPFPAKDECRAIAHILGTLDDKIELNRKQNETLEAMARALFKAWFVDFEPVRAKMEGRWQRGQSLPGLPAHLYDLFPDKLVESELGEIPEGWRSYAFGDVAQQGKGTINPGNSIQNAFTHYSLPAFDSAQTPIIELGETIKSNKTPVPDGAVLVSKLNPHIPRIWLVGKAGKNAVCSTEFIVWTPKDPTNSAFLYCLSSSPEFNSAMRQLVTGTSNSHQRVKPEQLREIRVIAGCAQVIEEFSKAMQLPIEQVLQHRQQSRSLTQLRDTLLPQLISGELRIQDPEVFLKEISL
jgi:type I restriction enzyme S subunit